MTSQLKKQALCVPLSEYPSSSMKIVSSKKSCLLSMCSQTHKVFRKQIWEHKHKWESFTSSHPRHGVSDHHHFVSN